MNWNLRFEERHNFSLMVIELDGEPQGAITVSKDEYMNFKAIFEAGQKVLVPREFNWGIK